MNAYEFCSEFHSSSSSFEACIYYCLISKWQNPSQLLRPLFLRLYNLYLFIPFLFYKRVNIQKHLILEENCFLPSTYPNYTRIDQQPRACLHRFLLDRSHSRQRGLHPVNVYSRTGDPHQRCHCKRLQCPLL